jgi:hypothetical protein
MRDIRDFLKDIKHIPTLISTVEQMLQDFDNQ